MTYIPELHGDDAKDFIEKADKNARLKRKTVDFSIPCEFCRLIIEKSKENYLNAVIEYDEKVDDHCKCNE